MIDMPKVREYLRAAIQQIYAGTTPEALRAKGMDILLGPVSFVDRHMLQCGEQRIRAKKVLIATGADPVSPAIDGLPGVPFSTYRNIFEAETLPATIAIIGGGPIGVEIGQAYQRLGTQVTIFAERLLAKEEPEVSDLISRVLQAEGVRIVPERAIRLEALDGGARVFSATASVEAATLLIASGRVPAVSGLNLEAAGVKYSAQGIGVNKRLRTAAPNIYAAGDVAGGAQFSHYAGWQGFQAARNALLPGSNAGFSDALPRVTFTDPEVAQVGLLEHEARARRQRDVRVGCWPLSRFDRAVCDNDRDGFLKIITRRDGTIVGATMVGRRAGDAFTEIVLAMQKKIPISDLASVIHPYPTYSSGIQLLATEMATAEAMAGASGRFIRAASKIVR
jgi:pyruvate/2-oxoglutarate dehydrogenase complex dihydrolipoamide dehydrogenase (E3) component